MATTIEREPPYVASDDRALIVSVSQIIGGGYKCNCGADAVLYVRTEPDGEPGAACFHHAKGWVQLATNTMWRLFGPKGEAA